MARGRKRGTVAQLNARGSKYANDRIDPNAELGKPDCPQWLDPDAYQHFHSLADALSARGVLTVGDGMALGLLADAMKQYIQAKKMIDKDGLTTTGSNGNLIAHPAQRIMSNAWDRLYKISREFGLTPATRTSAPQAPRATGNTEEDELFGTG